MSMCTRGGIVTAKDILDLVSSGLESAAILVGGYWSYHLFWRTRQHKTRASLEQEVLTLPRDDKQTYCKVSLKLTNTGNVAVYPWLSIAEAKRVKTSGEVPELTDGEIAWERIGQTFMAHVEEDFLLEPGESAVWFLDHVLPADLEAVEIYTKVYCGPKAIAKLDITSGLERAEALLRAEGYVWEATSLLDLRVKLQCTMP